MHTAKRVCSQSVQRKDKLFHDTPTTPTEVRKDVK
jgi:hypothetical protein